MNKAEKNERKENSNIFLHVTQKRWNMLIYIFN